MMAIARFCFFTSNYEVSSLESSRWVHKHAALVLTLPHHRCKGLQLILRHRCRWLWYRPPALARWFSCPDGWQSYIGTNPEPLFIRIISPVVNWFYNLLRSSKCTVSLIETSAAFSLPHHPVMRPVWSNLICAEIVIISPAKLRHFRANFPFSCRYYYFFKLPANDLH